MITCDPADSAFGRIHNRMPVILNKAERRLWMNAHANKEQLLALLRPCSDELFEVSEYSRKPLKAPSKKAVQPASNLLF